MHGYEQRPAKRIRDGIFRNECGDRSVHRRDPTSDQQPIRDEVNHPYRYQHDGCGDGVIEPSGAFHFIKIVLDAYVVGSRFFRRLGVSHT